MTVTVRGATRDDLATIHPDETVSYRAWVVEVDGERQGIIGLALSRPYAQLFCWIGESLRPHLRSLTVMRLVKRVKTMIEGRGLPVLAIRDMDEAESGKLLTRLGFEPFAIIEEQHVYMWSRG